MAVALVQDFNLASTGTTAAVGAGQTLVNVNGRAIDEAGNIWSINASHQLQSVASASDWLTKHLQFPDAGGPYTQQTLTKYAGPWTTTQKLTAWICYDPATDNGIWATFNLTTGVQGVDIYVQQGGVASLQTTNLTKTTYTVPGSTNSHNYVLCISNADQPGKIVASVYDTTANGGIPILTTADPNVIAQTIWAPPTIPITSGKFADAGFNSTGNRTTRLYMQGNALTANPNALLTGYPTTTQTTVDLVGLGITWTPGTPGSPTFGFSGPSGSSLVSQVVNSATDATLVIQTGAGTGNVVITDPTSGFTVTIPVAAPTTLVAGQSALVSATSAAITVTSAAFTGGRQTPLNLQWYRDLTPNFTPGAGNLLSNGAAISGATSLTLIDGSALAPGTTYYYKLVGVDVEGRTATTLVVGASFANPALPMLCVGTSLYQRQDGDAVTPHTPDAIALYLSTMNGVRTVTPINCGHSGSSSQDWLPSNSSTITAVTTGSVNDTAPTQTSWVCAIPATTGDQWSGATLTWTSGTQNGNTATVGWFNFTGSNAANVGRMYVTGGNMTGAPANGDTFSLSGLQNYCNCAIAAGVYNGCTICSFEMGTNDPHTSGGITPAQHLANYQTIIAALQAGIPTLTLTVVHDPPYFEPQSNPQFTEVQLALMASYSPVLDGIVTAKIKRGDKQSYSQFANNQAALIGPDLVHPTQAGVRALGLNQARAMASALNILPTGGTSVASYTWNNITITQSGLGGQGVSVSPIASQPCDAVICSETGIIYYTDINGARQALNVQQGIVTPVRANAILPDGLHVGMVLDVGNVAT